MTERDGKTPPATSPQADTGYGKPPEQRRFQSSGNPKGRPRGSVNRKTIVKRIAREMHSVTENGQRRRYSTVQLVLLRLRKMVLQEGNPRAFDLFHRLQKTYTARPRDPNSGFLVVPETPTEAELEAMRKELSEAANRRRQQQLSGKLS